MFNHDHILAVVETAQTKAPLIRPALLQMPNLDWAHASIKATDQEKWTYGTLLALLCVGRALLLSRTATDAHDALTEAVGYAINSRVANSTNMFPSLDLEEFDVELRDVLTDLATLVPTLAFRDRMNAALGQCVCKWVGLIDDSTWESSQRPLLHMAIGGVCNLTVWGNLDLST